MMHKSELIGIVAIVAVGFASPAFAQQPAVTVYDSGVNAFDMVPAYGGAGSFAPAAHGGGSFGYNENLASISGDQIQRSEPMRGPQPFAG
jgi:hypothetical protein